MKNKYTIDNDCSIYPGVYHPLPEMELLQNELSDVSKAQFNVKFNQDKNCIKLEAQIPGVRRENILIHVDHKTVSIVVIAKKPFKKLERHINLPTKVDPEFGCAEFKDGLLQIYFIKSDIENTATNETEIIVY